MADCAPIHPSTALQRACESLQKKRQALKSRRNARGWHKDTTNFRGSVYVCVSVGMTEWGGVLRRLTAWRETSGLQWIQRVLQTAEWLPALWLESIRQSSTWPGESSHRHHPPPSHLAMWNQDRWLHSDRIIPNLVLIYTVHIIHFYNMTSKTSDHRDGLFPGTGLGFVLIFPDSIYHLKAMHTSEWDFITESPWDSP